MAQRIRVFIFDGIVDCAYVTDPETEITIVDFDKCKDSREELENMYKEMDADKEMNYEYPSIIHP